MASGMGAWGGDLSVSNCAHAPTIQTFLTPFLLFLFAFVREHRSPSSGSFFSFMTEGAKWKTNNTFRLQQFNSYRIFALIMGFGARTSNGVKRSHRGCAVLKFPG
ncbi:hypothetical protein AVEN_121179-1 [Araneus ventricosus]|uniref:Uncharacterized protein n=1 Tax=Araneus ventricosus TaxID=182803 RepID=A0A4Y2KLN8_ARAVE|nr:hypothetical protein AVEN_121179-1 [Araneus ventricosus]